MESLLTTSNITFVIGAIGVIFTVYSYFKDPQVAGDKKDALLAQQVQWTIEGNERRFTEVQNSVKDAFSLAQNHTHTVEGKVDGLTVVVSDLGQQVIKLATIIDERIPKKIT